MVGVDNLNEYYDPALKEGRLHELTGAPGFEFHAMDIAHRADVEELFAAEAFDRVIHLAGQVGVRFSVERPSAYIDSNLVGFGNVLEGCRHSEVEHLVYASSSSVYGANESVPFSTAHSVEHPVSLYAATKKANELMAHSYSHLYGIPTTGLRFFTVYGPWGRPDMAMFLFTKRIIGGQPIKVFNEGRMMRDFTYIDDVVEGILRVADRVPAKSDTVGDPSRSKVAPYRVYNIGNSEPVDLLDFIEAIEDSVGIEAVKELLPMQPGDVEVTYADVRDLMADTGFQPHTPVREGVRRFVEWYLDYYQIDLDEARRKARAMKRSNPRP